MSYVKYNGKYATLGGKYATMSAGAPTPSYPTDGLFAYWEFNDSLVDSINGYTLEKGSGTTSFIDGKKGKALVGDGNTYFSCQDNNFKATSGGAKTIVMWVDPYETTASQNSIINLNFLSEFYADTYQNDIRLKRGNPGESLMLTFLNNGSGSGFYNGASGLHYDLTSGFLFVYVKLGYQLTGLGDTIYYEYYINGSSVLSAGFTLQDFTPDIQNTGIGLFVSYGGDFFKGALDSLMLYNRFLTPTEIAQLYNNGAGV